MLCFAYDIHGVAAHINTANIQAHTRTIQNQRQRLTTIKPVTNLYIYLYMKCVRMCAEQCMYEVWGFTVLRMPIIRPGSLPNVATSIQTVDMVVFYPVNQMHVI